ncbi:hypothetical protein PFISCL1PPCAC_12585 [Pristionchus fissidentatus]|uniref:Protein kinase domain-containing protein n=1 Tax=Pristionchus fissidentatus TaxID=1538716 RepID=A0AAV5VPB4_9BILA|nr:hypothetical protein PFISCL1PPCAC_12585 [Pristionchus fissidentatus]
MGDGNHPLQVGKDYANNRWSIKGILGSGTFGHIYAVRDNVNHTDRAMKVMSHGNVNLRNGIAAETAAFKRINEKRGNRRVSAPLITSEEAFEMMTSNGARHTVFIMNEYGPSVFDVLSINRGVPFPPEHTVEIAKQMLEAIQYLHGVCFIAHLDVKPENVLFESNEFITVNVNSPEYGNVKVRRMASSRIRLIDFNSSCTDCSDAMEGEAVTMHYRAPELVLNLPFSKSVDVFAVGAMLFELWVGCSIFELPGWEECSYAQFLVLGVPPQAMLKLAHERCARPENGPHVPRLVVKGTLTDEEGEEFYQLRWPTLDQMERENGSNGTFPLRHYFQPLSDDYNHRVYKTVESLMSIDPSRRPSASQSLHLPLFNAAPTAPNSRPRSDGWPIAPIHISAPVKKGRKRKAA